MNRYSIWESTSSKAHLYRRVPGQGKGLSNYNNWRQSVMTLKQKIAGAELYFSRAYSSFWWSQENGWRSYNCHSKNYHVGLFRNAKGSKETWVLPHTNQTQYQKWMSQKLNVFKNYFICTLPKHIASIDFSKRPLEHAFAPHFASNYCSCWAPWAPKNFKRERENPRIWKEGSLVYMIWYTLLWTNRCFD